MANTLKVAIDNQIEGVFGEWIKTIDNLRKEAEMQYAEYESALNKVNNTLAKISGISSSITASPEKERVQQAGKRRGRPSMKDKTEVATTGKRRGRPPMKDKTEVATTGKRRGRPPMKDKPTVVSATGKRRGRPPMKDKMQVITPVPISSGKRRGRPPKQAVAVQVSDVKVVASSESVSRNNPKSLRETCWEILQRSPSSYRKILTDYPEGAVGLKVPELKEIIVAEGKWTSSSDDIGAQIQNALHTLRNKDGKLDRNDDRRYYIIDGKTLND